MKVMNIICLLIWCFQLVYGIVQIVNNKPIDPIVFICAVLICIINYLNEIFQ